MAETELSMSEDKLKADFNFSGNLCSRAYSYEDLECLNESSVCHIIMDFTPGEENIMNWANAAYLHVTCQTMEEFTKLKASDCSSTLRKMQAHYFEQIQVKHLTEHYSHTIYPKGKVITFLYVQRPFRLFMNGSERVVIFCDLIPVNKRSSSDHLRYLEELLRYTNVSQLMIDAKTFLVVSGNVVAQLRYHCSKDFILNKEDRKLHIDDIFGSFEWDSAEQRSSHRTRVSNLNLQSEPIEMEVHKPAEGGGGGVWHKLVWVPGVNPLTGLQALMLSEYDISELKQVQEDLKAANRMQELAFASISHELRTPLNGIIGLSDAMLAGGCPANMARMLTVIKAQGMRLNGLVSDILDAASARRGKLVVTRGEVDLHATAEVVCELLKPLVKRNVSLINDIGAEGAVPAIEGDSNRMTQVLTNLVANAIKFTDDGHITIRARAVGVEVVLAVSDSGPGIPPDKLDAIWGAFEQESVATTRKHGGTGLGLTLVKALVAAHGGRCSVQSQHGGRQSGTTFTVVLPMRQSRADDADDEESDFAAISEVSLADANPERSEAWAGLGEERARGEDAEAKRRVEERERAVEARERAVEAKVEEVERRWVQVLQREEDVVCRERRAREEEENCGNTKTVEESAGPRQRSEADDHATHNKTSARSEEQSAAELRRRVADLASDLVRLEGERVRLEADKARLHEELQELQAQHQLLLSKVHSEGSHPPASRSPLIHGTSQGSFRYPRATQSRHVLARAATSGEEANRLAVGYQLSLFGRCASDPSGPGGTPLGIAGAARVKASAVERPPPLGASSAGR